MRRGGVPVMNLTAGVQAISGGDLHTCAIVNGGVRCWGENGSGQLGVDPTATPQSSVAVQVPGLSNGTTVDSGVPVLVGL